MEVIFALIVNKYHLKKEEDFLTKLLNNVNLAIYLIQLHVN